MTGKEKEARRDAKADFIEALTSQLKTANSKYRPAMGIGYFTSAIPFGNGFLTLGTDGVGSKIMIARMLNRWDTVGIDCIAMNVNDTICIGATPIALVDYIALPSEDSSIAASIGKGLNEGARIAGANIVGGEVALLPDMLKEVDISATCLGFAGRKEIISGKDVREGDEIVGLASSGLHSNGYAAARKIIRKRGIGMEERIGSRKIGSILLEPTYIYSRPVLKCMHAGLIHGMANITGGGFRNVVRISSKFCFRIERLLPVHRIFNFLQSEGNMGDREMFETFNMGTGFVIVVKRGRGEEACGILKKGGAHAEIMGHVEKGRGVVLEEYGIEYTVY